MAFGFATLVSNIEQLESTRSVAAARAVAAPGAEREMARCVMVRFLA
jgi:hypothetical protein